MKDLTTIKDDGVSRTNDYRNRNDLRNIIHD
jgi:hypothetical protein